MQTSTVRSGRRPGRPRKPPVKESDSQIQGRIDAPAKPLTKEEYVALAGFRSALRAFLSFSETAAGAAGLTPRRYQALLAIKGAREKEEITVGELARSLNVRPHSVVTLVDSLSADNLVRRRGGTEDRRQVFVSLTPQGEDLLARLAAAHRRELVSLRPEMTKMLEALGETIPGEAAGE